VIRLAHQAGYILMPVIVVITLVAAIALLMNTESALESNTAGSELDAQQAQYVAQAGLNNALWLSRQQGCSAYTDLTNVSLGNDQYTTILTTDLGTTTNYSIPVDQDAWIRSSNPSANNAIDDGLHTRFEDGDSERSLLRYDLSALPANASILSATAWFYVTNPHPEGPIDIHASTADWLDTDATWNSMGDKMDKVVLTSIPAQPTTNVWVSANLTSQVQAWVNGQPNYGITLDSNSEGSFGEYNSTESANAPYLEVVVGTSPSSPATLKAVGTLANGVTRSITRDDVTLYQHPPTMLHFQPDAVEGEDAEIWDQAPNNNYGAAAETWVSSASNDKTRSLLRFNLDAIPAGARILGATLSLYHRDGSDSNVPVSAHRITSDWIESEVTWNNRDNTNTWNNPGGDYDPDAVSTTLVDSGGTPDPQRYEWDISSLVLGWINGSYPNFGVVLLVEQAGFSGERFDTSDHADPTHHPRLNISYTCACGEACVPPQGSGKIAMIGNYFFGSPDPRDSEKEAIIESWGYEVDILDDDTIASIDFSNYDLVYISETAASATVGTQLTSRSIGIVNEQGDLNDELELADAKATKVGSTIDIVDNSHYITAPFAPGTLPIYSAEMELLTVSGTEAPGLQTLADVDAVGSLVLLDQGAITSGGGPAAGRRVTLPLGRATNSNFNWDQLNHNGRLIVQRALAWGIGVDMVSSGNLLLVVVNPGSLNTQESAKKALIESWGYTVNLIDESDSQANFDAAAAANDVAYIPQDITSSNLGTKLRDATIGVVNEEGEQVDELGISQDKLFKSRHEIDVIDNTHYITQPFASGLLTITSSDQSVHMLASNQAPGLLTLGQSFNTGALWEPSLAVIETGDDLWGGGTAAGRRVQLPWGGGTFDINQLTDDGRTIMQRAIEWAAGAGCASSPPLLLVVGDAATLSSKDAGMKSLMESWCYSVTLIDDSDSQANFDAAAAAVDVVYVSGTTSGPALLDKLTGSPTPIVNEINGKLDNFGFSSSTASSVSASTFSATDASHYISEPFGGSAVTVFSTSLTMPIPGGTLAPDLQIVGETTGAMPALVTLENGAQRWDGNPAPARRVHLPFTNAEPIQLTADGETLMQRAIEWAVGVGMPPPGYLDEFNSLTCDPASDYTGSDGLLDWSPWAWTEINESDGPCAGQIQIATDPLIDDPGSHRLRVDGQNVRMYRTVDLTVLTNPELSFDYRLVDYPLDDFMRIRVSTNGGIDWTELDRFEGPFDHTEYQSASYDLSPFVAADTVVQFEFNGVSAIRQSYIDNVHIQESVAGPPAGPGYTEMYQPWSATSADTWQTVDLGAFGVPADAVVEVAVTNIDTGRENFGGVRALGSSLERRFALHEAESGGVDAVTMHVQTDASSQIQHYADRTDRISFILLGYWTGASYVERFDAFKAGANASWQPHDLGAYGVGPNQVAEIALSQTSTSIEWLVGARRPGSGLTRLLPLHEAQGGGIDMVTLMAGTDASSIVEVYAEADSVVDFHLLGYWSTPPGTYTETGNVHGQATLAGSWETTDLSSFGVPADSIAQFVISNERDANENQMGVRATGSTIPNRRLDLQEAESGGGDLGTMHVQVDASAQIQWAAEYGATEGFFYPVGWWVLSP